ncbi:tetratricopeptide repeat protein [Streptomyces canus]|uniref:tetratricopeptide repeat protein n=1 Tax=Streptomyces canus TaxID=58343 RepID=UPI0027871417|nr:tetratricopeptide repeat protein [Streptomyces canus]MDQ0762719.1 tetratricopeptide (TPR) repeat protein [Streptomyces canus]
MAGTKNCFVIMPIRKPGTEEYEHYRALRDTVIEPVIKELGYKVTRADDVAKGGAITADIVRRLTTADLVVADLTDLNANVFYELGIRHALRGQGTVMMVDTEKSTIPFDLKPYRIIEFSPDLRGVEKLRSMLVNFAKAAATGEASDGSKDNPVHDFLPSLPDNIFSHAKGSTEGDLREENARLKTALDRYGIEPAGTIQAESIVDVISLTLGKAQRGELPVDLANQARTLAHEEKRVDFLGILMQLVNGSSFAVSANTWMTLASDALALDLPDVAIKLQERALELRPNDQNFKRHLLGTLAHSEDPRDRERAREELGNLLGIRVEDGGVILPDHVDDAFAIMLDAYHRDGLDDAALKITKALVEKLPDNTVVLRNHARALNQTGKRDASLEYYSRAVTTPGVDASSAAWLGSAMATRGRQVDAIEAHVRACEIDPDDSEHYADAAAVIASALRSQEIGGGDIGRMLPTEITKLTMVDFLVAAFSCPIMGSDTLVSVQSAAQVGEIDPVLQKALVAMRSGMQGPVDGNEFSSHQATVDGREIKRMSRRERVELLRSIYPVLASDLTKIPNNKLRRRTPSMRSLTTCSAPGKRTFGLGFSLAN